MRGKQSFETGGLNPNYQTYKQQKCFIGYSHKATWRDDIVSACDEVLPEFGLEPWYADNYLDPTKSLQDTVVDMIANARYGIYDLSYWRKDDTSEWVMPCNVLIELGIAIALNRPTLLLQHEESRQRGPKLPECLEGIRNRIVAFSGGHSLKGMLTQHLPQWVDAPPDRDWINRYCLFGEIKCAYRVAHPFEKQWRQEQLQCLILDGEDADRSDFRGVIEEVLGSYNNVTASYLNERFPLQGFDFSLCTCCQAIRSTPLAIYRITLDSPGETFIAIGICIALETLFKHKIPKILLATDMKYVPSLLTQSKVIVAKNSTERKRRLQEFLPSTLQLVRKSTWKPRPLPFIEFVPLLRPKSTSANKTIGGHIAHEEQLEKSSELNGESGVVHEDQIKVKEAIEGKDLSETLMQRRMHELEILQKIDHDLIRHSDLDSVLATLLQLAIAQVPAEAASILLYDPHKQVLETVASLGLHTQSRPPLIITLFETKGITRWALANKKPARVDNVHALPWRDAYIPEAAEIVSELDVPMIDGEEMLGVINLESTREAAFSQEDELFLVTLAGQAVLAIKRAQAYEREKRLAAEGAILNQISKEITSQLNRADVFDLILAKALELTNSHMGNLMLYDTERNDLWIATERGASEDMVSKRQSLDQGIVGHVAKNKQLLDIADVTQPPWNEIFLEYISGTRSELAVPILAGNELRGVLNVESSSPNHFSETHERLLQGLADIAVIALENAERYEKAQKRFQDNEGIDQDYQHAGLDSQGSDTETIQNDPELDALAARLEATTPAATIDPAFREALRDKLLSIQEEHVVHASTEEITAKTETLLAHESTSEKSKGTIQAVPSDEILATPEELAFPRENTGLSTIWFIRNGENESDAGLPTSSPAEVRLTERGLNQAESIARSITKQPSLIITSSYMSAKQTAMATMQRYPSVRQEIWPVHEFTYLSSRLEASSTVAERRPLVDIYWEQCDPSFMDSLESESFVQFISRVRSVIERLKYFKEDFILVFSHEQYIRAALWLSLFKLTNIDSNGMEQFRDFLTSFSMPHGSIVQAQLQEAEINWGNISTSHLLL